MPALRVLRVNGQARALAGPESRLLLDALREDLGLTGTREGCRAGECGACTVRVGDRALSSCQTPLWAVEGREVWTVEGVEPALQAAFEAEQAAQCGYCSAGMLAAASALLARQPDPDEAAICTALERQWCRCGAHPRIVRAVRRAAAVLRHAGEPPALAAALQRHPRPGQWLSIDAHGTLQLLSGKVEIGQGIQRALARLVAAELGWPLARIRVPHPSTATHPDEGMTSGSLSMQDSGAALRTMAAALRERLCAAAARRWGLQAHEVSLVEAELLGPQGQRLPAHELLEPEHLEAPVTQPVHTRPPLCSPTDSGRLADLPDALTRRAVFTGEPHFLHDLQLPGMVHGRVLHPPAPCDVPCDAPAPGQAAPALPTLPNLPELPGQLAVWRDGALFGVLAERPSQAEAIVARLAAALRWQPAGPAPCPQALDPQAWGAAPGPAEVPLHVSAAEPAPAPRLVSRREPEHLAGSTPAAEPTSRRTLRSRYTRPWLAHASIGPACAVARWRGEGAQPAPVLEVWTHSQGIFPLRRDLALAFGLAPEDVVVHHRPGAGCYGHNGADDAAFDAAWLAQHVPGRPVRTLWSRDEELRQAPLGPAMAVELAAELDDAGRILRWRHTLWSPGHSSRPGRAEHPALLGHAQREGGTPLPPPIDMPIAVGGGAERNAIPGYALPSWEVWAHRVSAPWRSSALRSLGAFANVFAAESFIDEIAQATGQDPLALREGLLGHDQRGLATLQAAARLAGWRRPEEALARAQGLGYARYKGTGAWCAVVAQVEVQATLVVRRLVVVADIGQVVDADGAAQQLEGGAIQATSWALKEAVRPDLQDPRLPAVGPGAVPMLTFDEVPEVDVVLLPSYAPPLGAGEASIGPTVAAIANALAAALGVRVRDLPLTPERIRAAIDAQA